MIPSFKSQEWGPKMTHPSSLMGEAPKGTVSPEESQACYTPDTPLGFKSKYFFMQRSVGFNSRGFVHKKSYTGLSERIQFSQKDFFLNQYFLYWYNEGWGAVPVAGEGVWPEGEVGGPISHALSRRHNPGSGISTLAGRGGPPQLIRSFDLLLLLFCITHFWLYL